MLLKDRRKLIIIGVVAVALIIGAVFFIFSRGKSADDYVKEYYGYLENKEYGKMYNMLTKGSLAKTSQKVFEARYKNIYEGIEAKNIEIKIGEVEDGIVNYTLTMDTLAGKISSENKVEVKDGELVYNEAMILEGLKEDYKIKINTDSASRGKILDRNGKELATKGEAYSVGLVQGKLNGEADYEAIGKIIGMSRDEIKKVMSASWIKDDSFVPLKEMAKDEEGKAKAQQLLTIKGVKLNTVSVRYYPYGEAASHVTGYLQQVNAEDLKKHKNEGYSETSLIGRSGIEAVYEADLKGTDGKEIIIIDKNNKLVETLATKKVENGKDIKLTIDADLQQSLYKEYQNDKSASVAMNPKTGEILALVSTPSFSSNDFIFGFSSAEWQALNDANKPLTNRFRGTYIPGSSMKPITAAIGLESNKIDPDEDFGAKDKWQKDSSWGNYYVTTLHAPKPNNLNNAIIYSDNVYFARAASEIGKEKLIEGYEKLKIGSKIPFELSLNASQYQNKDSKFDDQQLADSGYGQGQLLLNPVQLASIYGAFVNEGTIAQPYLVIDEKPNDAWIKDVFSKDTVKRIKEALVGVISDSNGTGHSIYHQDIELAGKTGTAELKSSQNDTSGSEIGWFTVMTTNSDNPVLITTMVEDVKNRGGSGYVVDHMKAPLGSYLYR